MQDEIYPRIDNKWEFRHMPGVIELFRIKVLLKYGYSRQQKNRWIPHLLSLFPSAILSGKN